jgi:hypothetical protein
MNDLSKWCQRIGLSDTFFQLLRSEKFGIECPRDFISASPQDLQEPCSVGNLTSAEADRFMQAVSDMRIGKEPEKFVPKISAETKSAISASSDINKVWLAYSLSRLLYANRKLLLKVENLQYLLEKKPDPDFDLQSNRERVGNICEKHPYVLSIV